jgi:hypothetical protein
VAAKRPPIRPATAPVIETWHVLCPAGKEAVLREWVVVVAVGSEPVSTPEFPANRENNREFRENSLDPLVLPAIRTANSITCG